MNEKMLYIWRLATFLRANGKQMSAQELAVHLNRNHLITQRGTAHTTEGHGPYRLISATWTWVHRDLGLEQEAENIALAFVKADGTHAWTPEEEPTAVSN